MQMIVCQNLSVELLDGLERAPFVDNEEGYSTLTEVNVKAYCLDKKKALDPQLHLINEDNNLSSKTRMRLEKFHNF